MSSSSHHPRGGRLHQHHARALSDDLVPSRLLPSSSLLPSRQGYRSHGYRYGKLNRIESIISILCISLTPVTPTHQVSPENNCVINASNDDGSPSSSSTPSDSVAEASADVQEEAVGKHPCDDGKSQQSATINNSCQDLPPPQPFEDGATSGSSSDQPHEVLSDISGAVNPSSPTLTDCQHPQGASEEAEECDPSKSCAAVVLDKSTELSLPGDDDPPSSVSSCPEQGNIDKDRLSSGDNLVASSSSASSDSAIPLNSCVPFGVNQNPQVTRGPRVPRPITLFAPSPYPGISSLLSSYRRLSTRTPWRSSCRRLCSPNSPLGEQPKTPQRPSEVASLVEESLGQLYQPFDSVRTQLIRQARDILLCRYLGDFNKLKECFLTPAASLLEKLKARCQQAPNSSGNCTRCEDQPCHVGCPCHSVWKGWPLCVNRRVLIQLGDIDESLLKTGDFYLALRESKDQEPSSPVESLSVSLVCRTPDSIKEHRIDEPVLLNMAWNPDGGGPLALCQDEELTSCLQHLLVSVERGIERIEWESASKLWTCNHGHVCRHGNGTVDTKDISVQTSPVEEYTDRIPGLEQKCNGVVSDNVGASNCAGEASVTPEVNGVSQRVACNGWTSASPTDEVDAVVHPSDSPEMTPSSSTTTTTSSSQSSATKDDDQDHGFYDHTLPQPNCISDLDQDLLHSRIAILPGCRDVTGRSVVVISCSAVRENTAFQVTASHLAQLLMYFHSIPKKGVISKGFLIFVDTDGVQESIWGLLDEAFCILDANIPNSVSLVLLWAKSNFDGAAIFPSSRVKLEMVSSEEGLRNFFHKSQLLEQYGGNYVYDHQEWICFRKFLEPFVNGCHLSGRHLVSVMQELRNSRLPTTAALTSHMIQQQKKHINRSFQDEQLRHLEEEGDTILKELESYRTSAPQNQDYRDALERSRSLYSELRRAMNKLTKLAERRMKKLEECLHLKTLEEESSQVLSWLCRKGEEALGKYQVVADSLGGIKEQEEDFEKFYFLAMRQIEKGNDLLEEAGLLSHQGTPPPPAGNKSIEGGPATTGMQEMSASLKQHLNNFTERLEDTREKLEDTSKCYNLLDRSYEWALDAMKFVSAMKMDNITPDNLSKLIKHLQDYLDDHPPIAEEMFNEMIELATKLDNERLLEQCKTAQARCQETTELIHARQATLLKARQHIEMESLRHQRSASEDIRPGLLHSASHPTNFWVPQKSSTPCAVSLQGHQAFTRRRSIATMPYSYGSPTGSYTAFPSDYYPGINAKDMYRIDHYLQEKEEHLLGQGLITDDLTTQGPVASISRSVLDARSAMNNKDVSKDDIFAAYKSGSLTAKSVVKSVLNIKEGHRPIKKLMRRSHTWQLCDDALEQETAKVRAQNEKLKQEKLLTEPVAESNDSCNPSGNEAEESAVPEPSVRPHLSHSRSEPAGGPVQVNSHLLTRASSLDLPDVSNNGEPMNEDQIKSKKTLMLIMREMIQTERDYVKSLEYIIENFIPELLREDIPQALRGQRNVIFGNIEKIYEFHSQYFLSELEECENSPFHVGQCFLKYEPQFYLYALYNKNKPKSDALMSEYGASFFRKKQLELGDKMDLASYLLKPVQRMGKYALLLKQLLKECPKRDPEHQDLRASEEMVRFQLRHGNDLLAMDALRDCDVNVKEQGRLLRQDEFLVWQGRSRKSFRHVFLFEDLILFSKARRDPERKGHDIYQYKHSIKTTDIGLTEQVGDSPTKFEIWFRKRKLNDTYVLQAPNPETKNAWVQEISKLLWKQALRNREMRLAEMSSMGIGNKPCLDIKPSEDQISDRFISIHQLSRGLRFRNSIAVSAFEQLRNNKRPHSIISVSSSSSSGSSQSSYYGNLNLGFEVVESPRPLHRSLTQQSQYSAESGFCTDTSVSGEGSMEGEQQQHHRHKKAERSDSLLSNDSLATNVSPLEFTSPPCDDPSLEDSVTTSM